jgi:hypothetical protein
MAVWNNATTVDHSTLSRRTWHLDNEQLLDNLKWSLQALALPADIQVTLFPSFVCIPDELALDFDHWNLCVVSNNLLSTYLSEELLTLNTIFDEMKDPDLWSLQALAQSEEWESVRRQAAHLLTLLGWEMGIPPVERAIYIQSKKERHPRAH